MSVERAQAARKEVKKLLEAGVIREVQFSEWLSNPVLIKKANGKWRMCIDFTALNKACPRDPFPLPHIDQLVNSTAGCELLSFLDAYSGYHQVWLHPEDEAKTSFVTPDGVYCYVRMPFGLRNAGATFARLIHSALEAQLGRNVEAYIDDVVIKSKLALDHAADLREMFDNLRRACIKLNLEKCTFGATRGKLLGYLVSKRGIEANPEKIKAITDMGSPRTPKEVHRLTGRLASLSRFLARSAENCLPFFAVLRGASPFRWTPECQQALDSLKTHLSKLTSLASPPTRARGCCCTWPLRPLRCRRSWC